MNRRALLAGLLGAAGGLVLPWEPRRVYSFGSPAVVVPPAKMYVYDTIRVFYDGKELREVAGPSGEPPATVADLLKGFQA